MTRLPKILFLLLASLLFVPSISAAQEGEMPPMGAPEEFNKLAYMLGEWDVKVQMKMDPNQTEWMESQATASITTILDGAIQQMDFVGDIMGMPFKGRDLSFYDRELGTYVSIWMDSMGARASRMEGGFEDGNMTMSGSDIMNGQPVLHRSSSSSNGADEIIFSFEMSLDDGESWFTHMVLTYTR